MKLAWLTDIHLNFLDIGDRKRFYAPIINTQSDAILISGDIAEAPCLVDLMREMAEQINKPIYFILGNHDYYRGTVHGVRETLKILSDSHKQLFWLPASGMQLLENNTILLGQDGWADGRLGDYQNSRISLNDSRMIADLFQEKILGKSQLLEKMQQLCINNGCIKTFAIANIKKIKMYIRQPCQFHINYPVLNLIFVRVIQFDH
jgi:predicted MPP superfamily phosphohydrolase